MGVAREIWAEMTTPEEVATSHIIEEGKRTKRKCRKGTDSLAGELTSVRSPRVHRKHKLEQSPSSCGPRRKEEKKESKRNQNLRTWQNRGKKGGSVKNFAARWASESVLRLRERIGGGKKALEERRTTSLIGVKRGNRLRSSGRQAWSYGGGT